MTAGVASPRVTDALRAAAARLGEAGCDSPGVDAEILLAHVLGTTRSGLHADSRRSLSSAEAEALDALLVRRERREPLAYVLGEWGFRRLTLRVDRRVLVPRPETEVVVERCLEALHGLERPRVLDVGTGSGAIALSVADEHPGARVTGIDASAGALEVAAENAARAGLELELRRWDLFAGLPPGPWDLVVSNPPYVEPGDLELLAPEVREWEPREALVASGATEAVARGARSELAPGRALVLETAEDAGSRVAGVLRDLGFERVQVTPDLAGRDRVVEGFAP